MSPNRLSWRYVLAEAAALALEPIRRMRGWVATSVRAAPAAAPRRIRGILRIIREPSACRYSPTMGSDRRGTRLFGTRYREPADWRRHRLSTRLSAHPPLPPRVPRSTRTVLYRRTSVPFPQAA